MWPILLLLLVQANSGTTITIFPTNPTGIENENLEIRVEVNQTYRECSFSVGNTTLNASSSVPGAEFWEDSAKSVCKMRLKPLINAWKGVWKASVTDADEKTTYLQFNINMKEAVPVSKDISASASVGSKFTTACASRKIDYAKIYDPEGSLVSEGPKAEINIPFVRSQDAGIWTCVVLFSNSLFQQTFHITLNVTSTQLVETSVSETEGQVNLLCRPSDITSTSCIFETPNGTMISVKPAVYRERYSFYGQEVYDCGLSIEKPLRSDEKGTWRCMMATPYASFLHVDGDTLLESLKDLRNVSVVAGTNLTLHCGLRQRLTYCYLRTPLGRVFSSVEADAGASQYTGEGLAQGDCRITVAGENVWHNESGYWTCGMGAQDSVDDVQVSVYVQIAASQFAAQVTSFLVNAGDSVQLKCRSVMGYGLAYCRFMHPSGRSLNLGTQSTGGRYKYIGSGIDSGECGLEITEIDPSDFGTWLCASTFVGEQWPQELRDKIILVESPMKTVTLIWMSVVLGLLAMGLVGGLFYWDRRRRNGRESNLFATDVRYGVRISQGSEDSELPSTPDSHSS